MLLQRDYKAVISHKNVNNLIEFFSLHDLFGDKYTTCFENYRSSGDLSAVNYGRSGVLGKHEINR